MPSSESLSENNISSSVLFKNRSFSILSISIASSSSSTFPPSSSFSARSSSLSSSSSFSKPSLFASPRSSAATSSSNRCTPRAPPAAIPPRRPSYPSLIRRKISLCCSFSSFSCKSFRALAPSSSSPSPSDKSSTIPSRSISSAISKSSSSSLSFFLFITPKPKSSRPPTATSSSSSSASSSIIPETERLRNFFFCFSSSASLSNIVFQPFALSLGSLGIFLFALALSLLSVGFSEVFSPLLSLYVNGLEVPSSSSPFDWFGDISAVEHVILSFEISKESSGSSETS
mmetsp:Transcript_25978/g.37259  ORF Transcript_25978/g.37259 Transcript_25978/m.37259 type:complete len:287 (+) Transcript_25978:665-1525(+)